MSGVDLDSRWPPRGKAGRNEVRKPVAGALNNAGLAFAVAALLQPALAMAQQIRPIALPELIASTIFIVLAVASFLGAQAVVRRLEV